MDKPGDNQGSEQGRARSKWKGGLTEKSIPQRPQSTNRQRFAVLQLHLWGTAGRNYCAKMLVRIYHLQVVSLSRDSIEEGDMCRAIRTSALTSSMRWRSGNEHGSFVGSIREEKSPVRHKLWPRLPRVEQGQACPTVT